jgi:hypothetical protein
MIQMTPKSMAALQSVIDEITKLSYRIREWEYLVPPLLNTPPLIRWRQADGR